MLFLETAWDAIRDVLKTASAYGISIPLAFVALAFYFFMRRGMKWSARQRYYIDLLKNLGIWKESLADRLDYYLEPGSQYLPDPEGDHFRELATKGFEAFTAFKELLPTARIFLSENSMQELDHLVSEHWSIKEFETVSMGDYLKRTFDEVKTAYDKLLDHAKNDFKRSQYLDIIHALKPMSK